MNNEELADFCKLIKDKMIVIYNRDASVKSSYDILRTDIEKQYDEIILKIKQLQMKRGELWQYVLGNYPSFTNLNNGHTSGLDIISTKHKIAIELKNRTNTDNCSSRKSNYDKLADFKHNNPEYMCIYGCINDDTKEKTELGNHKVITHKNVELHIIVGYSLINLILGDDTNYIIDYIKQIIQTLISVGVSSHNTDSVNTDNNEL